MLETFRLDMAETWILVAEFGHLVRPEPEESESLQGALLRDRALLFSLIFIFQTQGPLQFMQVDIDYYTKVWCPDDGMQMMV